MDQSGLIQLLKSIIHRLENSKYDITEEEIERFADSVGELWKFNPSREYSIAFITFILALNDTLEDNK